MAMYEDKGYCPNNGLRCGYSERIFRDKSNGVASASLAKLADRAGYMVYAPNEVNYSRANIDSFILHEDSELLGFEFAVLMEEYIPTCKYAEIGKQILLHDVINPNQVPQDSKILRNHHFKVGIKNREDIVEVWIFYTTAGNLEA